MNFNQLNIGFQNNQHFLIDNNINMMNNNMNNINNNNMIQMNNNNLNMMNNNTNMYNNMNIYNNNMNMYNNNLNMNNTNIYYNNNINLDMNYNNVMINNNVYNNNMNEVNNNNMNMINNNNMNMLNNNMNIMNINNNMNMMNMNMAENIIGNISNINSDNNYIRPKNLIPRVNMKNPIDINAYPGGNNAEKLNVVFSSSTGLKILMRTPPYTPIKNFIRKYLEIINLGEEVLNGGIMFLYNASQIDVNSDMPIDSFCVGKTNVITVIDIQYVIGG